MSEGSDESRKKGDEPAEEDREEIARRIADVLGRGAVPEPDEEETLQGPDRPQGKLKLDKTGALVGRPKLVPKRPYARPGKEAPGPEAGSGVAADGGAPQKAEVPPPLGSLRPPGMPAPDEMPADDEVLVPGGEFLQGEDVETHDVSAFRIDRFPVTNADYAVFVRSTGHRPPLYWPDGQVPEELERHPVVGVDYFDALAYAQWRGKDLPFEDEWERAARGTDGRIYPWGSDPELGQANTARLGHKVTVPIGWHELNVSPDGVHDMVGNVWEITHSPAPGGGIVVRGGSWYDFVLYAKTWFRFASRPDARNGTIGFRCVRRESPRPDALREVGEDVAAAEIASRRGPQPAPDASMFSAERRDLVPDYRRLKRMMAERLAEEEEQAQARGPGPAAVSRQPTPQPGPGRVPVRATPPPPIVKPPVPKAQEAPDRGSPTRASPARASPARASPARASPARASPAPKPPTPQPPAPKPPAPKPPARKADAVAQKAETSKARGGPALDRAGLRHAADMAVKGAVGTREAEAARSEPGTPLLYWGFLAAALALVVIFLGLVVSGVIGEDEEPPPVAISPGTDGEAAIELPVPPTRRLPEAQTPDPRDQEDPQWIDGAREGWDEKLASGVWVVVFAPDLGEDAGRTVRTASNVHRRLRDRGAKLLLVFPRGMYVGDEGRLESPERMNALLKGLGGIVDLNVLLDAPVGSDYGGALRTRFRVTEPVVALVLVDGIPEHKTSPLRGGLTLDELDPLAVRASEIRPGSRD